MRFLLSMTAALTVLAAPAAQAADPSSIGCVAEKVDAAVRAQIAADVARNLSDVGKRPSYDPSVGRGLNDAASACATANGWPGSAARAAGIYALASIGLPVAKRVVSAKGFDPEALDALYRALPEETRSRALTADETQGLIREAVTEEAMQTRENAELLAEYFAFVNTLEYAARQFSE
ncbi:hypothetical protein ACX40Y_13005 [Sphingomonas sp. RS6]